MNAILYGIGRLFVITTGIIIAGGQKLEKSLPLINTSKKIVGKRIVYPLEVDKEIILSPTSGR